MGLVRPTRAFTADDLGAGRVLGPDDILDDSHPFVRAHPDCFEPVTATVHLPDGVERATAEPGEKRGTRR